MEEIEPKSTIGAIAVLLVGRESSTELAGNTLALVPYDIELRPEVLAYHPYNVAKTPASY